MKAVIVDKFGSVENMKYVDVEMPTIETSPALKGTDSPLISMIPLSE